MLSEKICKALKFGGTHTPEDVEKAVARQEMQAWMDGESIIITKVVKYPLITACEIFLAAGDLDTCWKIHDKQIVPWAKEKGCKRMQFGGRKGWLGSMAEHGYEARTITADMEI